MSELLKDLFKPVEIVEVEETTSEAYICIYFKYGPKHYCAGIDSVKEIIDFPHTIPFPVEVGPSLGVCNLRGNIVPVMDPERFYLTKPHGHKGPLHEVTSMKARLIVFEIEPGVLAGLPVTEVDKAELNDSENNNDNEFTRINGLPYDKFDVTSLFGGAA